MNVRFAGDGASMTASFCGEVEIGIGEFRCHHLVYVAALQDSMLLGIDFLQAYHICAVLGSSCSMGLSKLIGCKSRTQKSGFAQVIKCELDAKLGHFL